MNELLLLLSVLFIFGSVLLAYLFFGKTGLYCVSAIATVLANIEVIILIDAFGMEQTLGNVLFASTFLITDILSECEGRKAANVAVMTGIFSQVFFLVLSQSWLLYVPSENDTMFAAVSQVFANAPRLIAASLSVYVLSQFFDVWLYHRWWALTKKITGDSRKFLWLRNNGSTLVSQLANSLLFTLIAFVGTYDFATLMSVFGSSYVIYMVTSLLDTPALYAARQISDAKNRYKKLPLEN